MQNYPAKEKWRVLSLDVGDQSQVGVNETKPNQIIMAILFPLVSF